MMYNAVKSKSENIEVPFYLIHPVVPGGHVFYEMTSTVPFTLLP